MLLTSPERRLASFRSRFAGAAVVQLKRVPLLTRLKIGRAHTISSSLESKVQAGQDHASEKLY